MAATFLENLIHHKKSKPEDAQGRGRNADAPTEIPAKGWKDILIRVKKEISQDNVSMLAASMAYYALLASVPALTSFVLLYAWFSDPADINRNIAEIARFIPEDVEKIIREQLTALSSKAPTTLGLSAIATFLFSLWSASKGSTSVIESMNIIYGEKESRSFIKRSSLALMLTGLGTVLCLVAVVVVVGLPAITGMFHFGTLFEALSNGLGWVLLLGIFSLFLSSVYRFGPNRQKPKWKWVSAGSVIASVLWALTSLLFTWYAANFGNFNKTYGSLGAVVVMMTWFYLSSYIILLGGEINSELEHQTKKDTTTGVPAPMGARGARMADTLGETSEEVKIKDKLAPVLRFFRKNRSE